MSSKIVLFIILMQYYELGGDKSYVRFDLNIVKVIFNNLGGRQGVTLVAATVQICDNIVQRGVGTVVLPLYYIRVGNK